MLAALLVVNIVLAIPAKPIWKTFVQKDGTLVTAKLVGDEHSHYWLTESNVAMVEKEGQLMAADINELKSKQMLRSRSSELGVPKTYVGDKKVMLRSQSVTPCQSVEAVFNLLGVRMRGKLETLPIGIYLVRYTDGRVRRVLR